MAAVCGAALNRKRDRAGAGTAEQPSRVSDGSEQRGNKKHPTSDADRDREKGVKRLVETVTHTGLL